jgi:hypothetical protein
MMYINRHHEAQLPNCLAHRDGPDTVGVVRLRNPSELALGHDMNRLIISRTSSLIQASTNHVTSKSPMSPSGPCSFLVEVVPDGDFILFKYLIFLLTITGSMLRRGIAFIFA